MRFITCVALIVFCCCCVNSQYVQKNVYYEKDCSGTPAWTLIQPNVCTLDANSGLYVITNCTGTVTTLNCRDSACTNCTTSTRTACYPEESYSSKYFCVSSIPNPPAGSYVEQRYGTPGCLDDPVYYFAIASGFCQGSGTSSLKRTCGTSTTLSVTTCSGSTCSNNCTTQPQATGCSTSSSGGVKITCTNGTAPITTGSTTSTSGSTTTTTTSATGASTTTTTTTTTARATTATTALSTTTTTGSNRTTTTTSSTSSTTTGATTTSATAATSSTITTTGSRTTTSTGATTGGAITTSSTGGSTTRTASTTGATTGVVTGSTTGQPDAANTLHGSALYAIISAFALIMFMGC